MVKSITYTKAEQRKILKELGPLTRYARTERMRHYGKSLSSAYRWAGTLGVKLTHKGAYWGVTSAEAVTSALRVLAAYPTEAVPAWKLDDASLDRMLKLNLAVMTGVGPERVLTLTIEGQAAGADALKQEGLR